MADQRASSFEPVDKILTSLSSTASKFDLLQHVCGIVEVLGGGTKNQEGQHGEEEGKDNPL